MSLEFLLALSQSNVVHPISTPAPRSSRRRHPDAPSPDDTSNLVHNESRTSTPPRRPASAPPRPRSSTPSSTHAPPPPPTLPNLVQSLPPIDPLAELDSQLSQRASARRARVLLRQQLTRGEEGEAISADAAAAAADAAVRSKEIARARKRARRRKEPPERDRARYLVNVGPIHRHLPDLLSVLQDRLMRRDYPSAAQLLSVLFRVRRLDSESILKAITQLLPLASTTPLTDMIRLYRRYLTYKPVVAGKGKYPPVLVKNAAQVVMELPLMLLRQGLRQNAYDALAAHAIQPPFDRIGLFQGYLGAIAVLLGMEAKQQLEEWREAGGVSLSQAVSDDEDDAPVSFSLAHFTQSQASQQPTVHSSSSTSALITAQHRLQVQSTASLVHLQQAMALQPDCDAWLYYAVESLTTLTPSLSSAHCAMQLVHRFTAVNPLHPTGWRLKQDLLLTHFPTFHSSILTSALHLLSIDPVHTSSLAVLAYFHSRRWVATDTLLRAAARSLDVDADEGSHGWTWLHAALHAVQRGGAAMSGALVSEEDERGRDGQEDEWEVAELLTDLQARGVDVQQQQRPDESKKEREEMEAAGGRQKRKASAREERVKRRRTEEAATPSLSAALPSTPTSAASAASPTARSSPSPLSSPSSSAESGPSPRFALFAARRPLSTELRGRVEWWMLSAPHMAGVRPLQSGQMCPEEKGDIRVVKRCCLALMLAKAGESEVG